MDIWNGIYEGSGKAVGDTIEGLETLYRIVVRQEDIFGFPEELIQYNYRRHRGAIVRARKWETIRILHSILCYFLSINFVDAAACKLLLSSFPKNIPALKLLLVSEFIQFFVQALRIYIYLFIERKQFFVPFCIFLNRVNCFFHSNKVLCAFFQRWVPS